jgi:KN motif
MLDHIELDQQIRLALMNLMVVLYSCGITTIHLGGLMRILGVSNRIARQYDTEQLHLDEDFVKYVDEINEPRPTDQLLH